MADAVISALLDQLVSITREQVEKKVSLVMGVDAEVESLRQNLEAIRMELVDAETRQLKEDGVKLWLDELKDVSYDMDSVFDKWNTAILKSKFAKGENRAESSTSNADRITEKKVWFSLLFSCFHFSKPSPQVVITHRLDIAEEIQSLNGKLGNITKRKDIFSFRRVSSNIAEIKRPDTTSLLDVPVVYGQDTNKKILIDRIMLSGSNREDKEQLKIIPLVGMGGIGKTTLAKNVYNDDEVKAYFEGQRVWVCVSEPFEIFKIAKEFIEQLGGHTQNIVGSESLMKEFRETVTGKKFLLVLDDVWTTRYKEWEPLGNLLRSGAAGSTVVVTTRKEEVPKMIGGKHTIHLNKLSEEDCWFLLSEIAFFEKTEQERYDFTKITRKFAQKCNGLPLAAKTLGSLLRVKRTKEWPDLLRSDMWDLENVKEDLFYPLLLSYYDLPSVERRCFLYCAIFPKDYGFCVDDLIRQWIAQGYFKSRNNDQELEQIGERCFQNLAMRSFFQDFEYDDVECTIKGCKMHDIVHDFAQYLMLNEYSILSIFDAEERFDLNARHLNLIISPMVNVPADSISNKVKLHTLMVSYDSKHEVSDNSLGTYMFPHQFLDLTRLKTLILIGPLMELPTNIGDLIHLRYLFVNKGYECTINVPPTIGNLFNLRTLRLRGTTELPEEVGKLINLRHLHVVSIWKEKQTWPKSIGMLTSLQNLSCPSVGPNSQKFQLRDFRNLNNLRCIWLTDLGTKEHVEEAKEAQLHKKTALVHLQLDFNPPNTNMEMETHESVLENLQPPVNLLSLGIRSYKGRPISPSWMMSLINLKELILDGCRNNDTLPALGKLPCLESLLMFYSDSLKKMGPEFLGVEVDNGGSESKITSATLFPKLKLLNIGGATSLCEWVRVPGWKMNGPLKIMPRLESLELISCQKLESLPDFLESTPLKNLKIWNCPILEESCQVETGKDWHKIRHVPNIKI